VDVTAPNEPHTIPRMADTGAHPTLSSSAQHSLAAARNAYLLSRVVKWPGGHRCVLLKEHEAAQFGLKDGDAVLDGIPVVIDYPLPGLKE
jgi:hypothetical protein